GEGAGHVAIVRSQSSPRDTTFPGIRARDVDTSLPVAYLCRIGASNGSIPIVSLRGFSPMTAAAHAPPVSVPQSATHDKVLFWGCFIALVTTAFGFIVRSFLIDTWEKD